MGFTESSQGEEDLEGPQPTETTYLPLLFNADQLLPGYNVRSVQRNAALPEKGRKGKILSFYGELLHQIQYVLF